MTKKSNIPKLQPQQLDDYLFGDWKPTVFGLYENFHVAPHRRSVYFFLQKG